MTKQELIEEIAKIIMQVKPCEALVTSECIKRKCKYPHYSGVTCIAEHQAEALYNAGYRKVGDDEVVISKEEYSDLKIASDSLKNACEVNERLKKNIERLYNNLAKFKEAVRKKTAKEILSKLKAMLIERFDYFGELRNKNLKANNDNVLFDLGQMDCINCMLDKVKELAEEYGVEIEK